MQKFIELAQKKKKLIAGIMSGTSVDGIDIVLLEISGSGTETSIKQIGFIDFPFPAGMNEMILRNSVKQTSNVEEICILNNLIAKVYAAGLQCLCEKIKVPIGNIDLIGSHGQTIQHLPQKKNYFNYETTSTLQIGDPAVVAKLTGIITVGDFRTGDMALGGEGAPLVPYFDFIMFRSSLKNRVLLNIGGISNFTVIRKNASRNEVYAFDTGPGNMMIDLLMKKFYNRSYDENGEIAFTGSVNKKLLNELKQKDLFVEKRPPKSTGRELYGEDFINGLLTQFNNISAQDWISTITCFTAYSIYRNFEKFVIPEIIADEFIVSGGGAKNKFIISSLREMLGEQTKILTSDDLGISADAKEAICFAVLANETINGNSTNMPKVTGARSETILGKICLP